MDTLWRKICSGVTLQRAPVSEPFIWRRWLYVLWDEVAKLVNTGRFSRRNSISASKSLLCRGLAWTNLSATARFGQAFHSQRGRYASTKPEEGIARSYRGLRGESMAN